MPDSQGNLTPAEVQALELAAATQLGRFSAPERWFSLTQAIAAAGGPTNIANTVTLNIVRPIESITVFALFRVTVAAAPYTSVAPEAPQNFIQRITLQGQHATFGNKTPIDLPGSTAFAWGRTYQQHSGTGEYLISKNGGALSISNLTLRPFGSSFDGTVGTHDIVLAITIPASPSLSPDGPVRKASTSYLYQPADWGNTMTLNMILGDASAFGDPTGSTVTFQGFGGSGNPLIDVQVNYALLGDFRNAAQKSGLVIRQEQPVPSQTALGNNVLLLQMQHQITTLVMLKSGNFQTGAAPTGGIDTLSALSDRMLDVTQIQVDNKALRNNSSNLVQKAYMDRMANTIVPEGYFPISFVDGRNALLAYRGDKLNGSAQFNLVTNVITAAASQRQRVTQEYILGGPFPV